MAVSSFASAVAQIGSAVDKLQADGRLLGLMGDAAPPCAAVPYVRARTAVYLGAAALVHQANKPFEFTPGMRVPAESRQMMLARLIPIWAKAQTLPAMAKAWWDAPEAWQDHSGDTIESPGPVGRLRAWWAIDEAQRLAGGATTIAREARNATLIAEAVDLEQLGQAMGAAELAPAAQPAELVARAEWLAQQPVSRVSAFSRAIQSSQRLSRIYNFAEGAFTWLKTGVGATSAALRRGGTWWWVAPALIELQVKAEIGKYEAMKAFLERGIEEMISEPGGAVDGHRIEQAVEEFNSYLRNTNQQVSGCRIALRSARHRWDLRRILAQIDPWSLPSIPEAPGVYTHGDLVPLYMRKPSLWPALVVAGGIEVGCFVGGG